MRVPSMAAMVDLKILRLAVNCWHRSEYGPLQVQPQFWKPPANPPRTRWLTISEAARLLRAARPYPYLRRAILIGLHTGSRPGVVMRLRWSQVDLNARVLYRVPKESPQDAKKRAPPVRLGRKVLAHLQRWKRLDGSRCDFVCHIGGQPIADPHTAWRKTLKASGLKGVTRHTLRHTRATWMMARGDDPWKVAGFLGMTLKTLDHVYAHHSPNYQDEVAN